MTSRHELNQGSTWFMMQKIRREMERKGETLLRGIIEADETYLGGRPRRKKNERGELPPPSKRGRGTRKTLILAAIER